MPTIFTHPAIALLKRWCPEVTRRAIPAGIVASVLPDADVVAFAFGIPYEHVLGHRGFTHSIAFAAIVAAAGTLVTRTQTRRLATFVFLFICAMSHGVFDALTDGGLGVAFFAPFSSERYFFPWTPIRVSPIGAGFFSARGMETLASELLWVWLPLAVVAACGPRRRRPPSL